MLLGRETNRWGILCARAASRSILCLLVVPGLLGFSLPLPTSRAASDPSEETSPKTPENEFWSFPSNGDDDTNPSPNFSRLMLLPSIQNRVATPRVEALGQQPIQADQQLIARLLPPQSITVAQLKLRPSVPANSGSDRSAVKTEIAATTEKWPDPTTPESQQPILNELSEQEQLLASAWETCSPAATGVLTDGRINELAKVKIQHAYAMANRNAIYVARQELIEVLRMISQAKDAQRGTPARSQALAAGIRALREAEDFAPRGTQLEAELDIGVLCASHRTPVAQQGTSAQVLPRFVMDRYFRYAQLQLAMSVAGEPAGSMALHALGKIHSQLGRVEPGKNRLADRRAIAYQQAALFAHDQNYLAAHELGVLLATSGHFAEAELLLKNVAADQPNAVVYRNLARVQEKLGQPAQALANRDHARQLSQHGATGTNNVQWVSPDQFAQGNNTRNPRHVVAQQPPAHKNVTPGNRQGAPPFHR